MITDRGISEETFYFASITFFTIGYGDICPMGLSKNIAILNALIGHVFTTIIVVLALSSFIEAKQKNND